MCTLFMPKPPKGLSKEEDDKIFLDNERVGPWIKGLTRNKDMNLCICIGDMDNYRNAAVAQAMVGAANSDDQVTVLLEPGGHSSSFVRTVIGENGKKSRIHKLILGLEKKIKGK